MYLSLAAQLSLRPCVGGVCCQKPVVHIELKQALVQQVKYIVSDVLARHTIIEGKTR